MASARRSQWDQGCAALNFRVNGAEADGPDCGEAEDSAATVGLANGDEEYFSGVPLP